jgi:hypothetical protein
MATPAHKIGVTTKNTLTKLRITLTFYSGDGQTAKQSLLSALAVWFRKDVVLRARAKSRSFGHH